MLKSFGGACSQEGVPSTSEGPVPATSLQAGWDGGEVSRGGVEAAVARV